MTDTTNIQFTVNLDALLGELQKSLQLTINLVSVALSAKIELGDEIRLPATVIPSPTFDASRVWSNHEAQERHQAWALCNGLRDVVEGLSAFLESAYKILCVWALVDRQKAGERLKGVAWQKEVVDAGRAFHRLGLPDKIEKIQQAQGIPLDEILLNQLLSINSARNCLVHRSGVVGERDKNDSEGLKVGWRKLRVFLQDEDGERDLFPGVVTEKDSTVCIQNVDHHKIFAIGQRVTFSAQEFADITWGLFVFGSDFVRRINEAGLTRGHMQSTFGTAEQNSVPPVQHETPSLNLYGTAKASPNES